MIASSTVAEKLHANNYFSRSFGAMDLIAQPFPTDPEKIQIRVSKGWKELHFSTHETHSEAAEKIADLIEEHEQPA